MNPKENFDDAITGGRTLFEMMSTEGWIDVMNQGMDSVGPTIGSTEPMQPKTDSNTYFVIYFVIFMIVGS